MKMVSEFLHKDMEIKPEYCTMNLPNKGKEDKEVVFGKFPVSSSCLSRFNLMACAKCALFFVPPINREVFRKYEEYELGQTGMIEGPSMSR